MFHAIFCLKTACCDKFSAFNNYKMNYFRQDKEAKSILPK